jgi:hypothetical protein
MKRFVLSIALLACLPVFAQDQPKGAPGYDFTVFRTASGYRINVFDGQLIVTSTSMQRIGDLGSPSCLLQLKDVEIRTNSVIVQADEADYQCSTGEIEPRGNVHLKVFPQ